MSLYNNQDNSVKSANNAISEKEYLKKMESLRNIGKKSYFIKKDLYDDIPLHSRPRPSGKIFKD